MGMDFEGNGQRHALQGYDIIMGMDFEGGRRGAASDTSAGTSNSSRATNARDTLVKR